MKKLWDNQIKNMRDERWNWAEEWITGIAAVFLDPFNVVLSEHGGTVAHHKFHFPESQSDNKLGLV